MALATAPRTPYRARTLVGASPARVGEAGLRRGIAAARAVVVALCAARVATDCVRGHASAEGALALLLFVVLTLRLMGDAIRARRRDEATPPAATPYRSAWPASSVAGRVRTSERP